MVGPVPDEDLRLPPPGARYGNPHGVGWIRATATGRLVDGPCLYWGIIVHGGGSSSQVTVRDGVDTGGRQYMRYDVEDFLTRPYLEHVPALFERGIHVTLTANVVEVLVRVQMLAEKKGGAPAA
jgi:hypothetical protein